MISTDGLLTVLTCLGTLQTTIILAGIPWAYSVHGRLTTIESSRSATDTMLKLLLDMEKRVTHIETLQGHGSCRERDVT